MTSLTGRQIVTIFHILPNISRNTGNQAMKFGQLIKYIMRNIFLQGLCRKRGGRLVPNLKKKRFKVKARNQPLSFNIFWQTSSWRYNKNKLYNIADC